MSSNSRGDRIQLLQKVLKKYFKPVPPVEGRSLLEQILFASCLEDARYESAEEAFQRVQELYFDWNEVRVTTVTELADVLQGLPNPTAAAIRIKRNLQSIFESRYSFDLEEMRKMNQGKAIQELEKLSGMSRFVLGYLVQNALGGHTIPISDSINHMLLMTGVVTASEAEKKQTPGLDRAIPKTKGIEFSSCLHQLAAEYVLQPQSKNIKTILKELGAVEIALAPEPVKPVKKAAPPKVEAKKPEPPKADGKKADAKKAEASKPEASKSDAKKVDAKKLDMKKADAKKPEPKKPEASTAAEPKKPEAKPTAAKKSLPTPKAETPAKPVGQKAPLKKFIQRKPK